MCCRKANLDILKGHLNHCVKEAVKSSDSDEKIEEIKLLLEKILSK